MHWLCFIAVHLENQRLQSFAAQGKEKENSEPKKDS